LAVLSELAEPGQMVLIPVVGRQGRIADFVWRSANPPAAAMLGCPGENVAGRTLREVLGTGSLCNVLFATYQRAFLSRSPQTVDVEFGDWRGRHDACPSAEGLSVVLMASSALERVVAAQRILRDLEEASRNEARTLASFRPGERTSGTQGYGSEAM
jgi:hypothetical protein